jgi:hypothetical protein
MVTFTPKDFNSGVGGWIYEVCGLVDTNGDYALGLNNDGSGAAIGEYTVTISARDPEIPNSNSSKIPAKYSGYSSPLGATVKEGDNKLDFVLE